MMSYLSERTAKITDDQLIELLINESNSILKWWEKMGLLEGIDPKERTALAFYYEATLQYINRVNPKLDEKTGKMELVLIPMIRVLYSRNKLDVFFLCERYEGKIYNNLVMDYANKSQIDDISRIVLGAKAFINFLPELENHYTLWEKNTWPGVMVINFPDHDQYDIDSEKLWWYCNNFQLSQIEYTISQPTMIPATT